MADADDKRPGELALPFDPTTTTGEAHVHFIGRIRSPWRERADCPHSLREARERSGGASIEILPAYRPGLLGLSAPGHVHLLYWLDRSRRDLIVQHPRHSDRLRGVFSLRTPVRPNPIGLALVRLLSLDAKAGILAIDAIDCLDNTPLLDMKPYLPSIDAIAPTEVLP